ncbi:MAG: hypothetical protein QXY14_05490, partial [Candidatus Nitrosocaldus sp.]
DDAYAVGDISALRLDDGSYTPQLAQLAVRQGYRVAMNILNSIDGKEIRPLLLKMQGAILSLGSECIGTIGGLRLEGELCRYVEEFITYNYKRMLHGDGLALLAYEDDPLANVVTFSRALSYLSVRYTLQLARLYATTLGLGCYIGAESAGVKRMNWLVR